MDLFSWVFLTVLDGYPRIELVPNAGVNANGDVPAFGSRSIRGDISVLMGTRV